MTYRPLEMLGFKTPMFQENPIFGLAPFTAEQRCGKLYWAETMPGPVEETRQLLQPTCKSRVVHAAIGLFIRPGSWLYHASSLAFLLAIPILLIARRWEALLLGPPSCCSSCMRPSMPASTAMPSRSTRSGSLSWLPGSAGLMRLRGADAGRPDPADLLPRGDDRVGSEGDTAQMPPQGHGGAR